MACRSGACLSTSVMPACLTPAGGTRNTSRSSPPADGSGRTSTPTVIPEWPGMRSTPTSSAWGLMYARPAAKPLRIETLDITL